MFWSKTQQPRKEAQPAARAQLAISLEPRMLFDGAVAATVADAAASSAPPATDTAHSPAADDSAQQASDAAMPPAATSDQRQEVVFIDGKVDNQQQLMAGLKPGTEVVVLDSSQDGLQQIADYLKGRSEVDAIHLLSHGADGTVELGNTWLNAQNIGQHSQALNAIGAAMASDGDILIYGCDTGEGAQGSTLLNELARLTQADVAASVDTTGAANKGGDWVLESRTGQVESQALQVAAYDALLAAPADENYDDDAPNTVIESNNFELDGIRYVLTGTATYQTSIADGGIGESTINNNLMFDYSDAEPDGRGGLSSVTISAADGSAFKLSGISFLAYDFGSSSNFTLTPQGGTPLSYTLNGSVGTLVHLDLSSNPEFQNITSFTFSGVNLIFEIDNLNFEAAIPPTTAPSLSATAANPTFTENGSAVDLFGSITAATNDSGQTFSGATLTVTNVSNGAAEILSIGGTDIALSNGGGTITGIGSYSVSVSAGTATVTLYGMTRDNTQMGTLIDGITYRNTSDAPGSASRVVTITQVTDSGSSNTAAAANIASTVTVTPVNDAPTLTATGGTPTYTENGSAVDLFSGVSIGAVESGQTITGMTLSVSNLANGSSEILGIDGTDIALTNGASGTTVDNGISYWVSLFGGTASITLTKVAGVSTAVAQTVVDGMSYRNSSDTPSTATRVVTLTGITDNGGTANGGVNSTVVSIAASVAVSSVNDTPTVANAIPNQNVTEDAAFNFQFAGNTFNDADTGDTLSYTAQLAGGGALPTWLSFDAATRTFSGTPGNANVGTLSIDVIASDGNGGTITDTFNIIVANTNDAPTVANAIPNQSVSEDTAFNFQFAGNTFSDADTGDTLTYTAQLAGGGALPTWLSFDAATRTFSGTPGDANAGTLSIDVIANDGNGGTVTDTFNIEVSAVNDAPTITAPVSISISEDASGALSGISFSDVDAGTGPVTVTLSVPSGSLAATSASGVTVGGTASAMTLSGSISDINAFIAASGVRFTTASNATANVTLTVDINDGGNTGTGGALTDSQTVTLMVTAVNDAPVNSIPAAQNVNKDANLVFNSGNGNLISISDVDAGANNVEVTLTASNGLLTLSGASGLTFTTGDGNSDASMTFTGSIADINNALNGLTFSPTAGYNGAASLQITTNDLGNSGSGGAQSDTDTLNITVNSLNPRITDVSSSTANGTYKVGDTITITTTFNQAVTVDTTGGTPTLLLETGINDRNATYVSGSGSNTLTFSYTVQAGDLSSDLGYQSTAALALNGATIRNVTSNDAVLTLPTMATAGSLGANKAIVIDGVAATVSSVAVPANGTYVAGQNLDFTVNLSENVTVDTTGGTPRIAITLDTGGTVYANYLSGSGSSALVFRLTVANGQMDSNGISLGSSIDANNGTLRDSAGNNSTTTLNAVGSTTAVLVDAVAPQVNAISLDSASSTNASSVTFTVTFSENVSGVDLGDFSLLTTGSANGNLVSLEQLSANTYRITVDNVSGLGNLGLALAANGSGIVDANNNALAASFSTPGYAVGTPTLPPSGDPQLMAYPAVTAPPPPAPLPPVSEPGMGTSDFTSPLLPPPLFEVRTIGGDLPPLGTIFLGDGSSAPSFIAQVFGSSDAGLGGTSGFLGFGGGDGGVFGSSTLAGIFGKDVPGVSEMNVFDGTQWQQSDLNQGLRGVFGVPTFGQQLHDLHEGKQRQVRELAQALEQLGSAQPQA